MNLLTCKNKFCMAAGLPIAPINHSGDCRYCGKKVIVTNYGGKK